jgi:hypothetical protein
LWWTEFHLVFPFFSFSPSIVAVYIFTAPTCKATMISLEPCALNADVQHFIPKFKKIFLLYGYPWKRVWGERRPKDRVTLQIILVFTLTCPKTLTQPCVSVFDKNLHWPCVSGKYIYTLQQVKCKCKKLRHLHLYRIYTPYIWLLTLTRTTLVETFQIPYMGMPWLVGKCTPPSQSCSFQQTTM